MRCYFLGYRLDRQDAVWEPWVPGSLGGSELGIKREEGENMKETKHDRTLTWPTSYILLGAELVHIA